MVYFQTKRLLVRSYTLKDVEGLSQVMGDQRVHLYTKDRNHPWDRQRTAKYVQFMIDKQFSTLDCFHGAVIEKLTGNLIGLCGLNPYEESKPEIEFKLGVPYWNKGYATELGREMVFLAFADAKVQGIYGMAHPDNASSRKVLAKIGMEYLGVRCFHNKEAAFYYISACGKEKEA